MKTIDVINRLKKKGYSVTRDLNSGRVIGQKNQQTFVADSYNGLYNVIFNK